MPSEDADSEEPEAEESSTADESDSDSNDESASESTSEAKSEPTPERTSDPSATTDGSGTAVGSATVSSQTEIPERVTVETLGDRVGDRVRIEGEIVSTSQTSGPTVFELRDETAVVDCAAFKEAGVRAYPEVDTGDIARLTGEVELRNNELQVETEQLDALDRGGENDRRGPTGAGARGRGPPRRGRPPRRRFGRRSDSGRHP